MSLLKIFDIAGSAMHAQSVRLSTTASNMANANSVSRDPEDTYRAKLPVFAAVLNDMETGQKAGGVEVKAVIDSQAPLRREYAPSHPMADETGYINLPNVNVVEELANMMSASRSYQSNVEVFNTSKQLLQRTLTLGK